MSFSKLRFYLLLAALLVSTLGPVRAASEKTEAAAPAAASVDRPVTDKWALLIGVSEFPTVDLLGAHIEKGASTTPRLVLPARADSLTFSVKDAVDVRNFLIYKAGFAPSHVKVLLNSQATGEKIRYYLGSGWLKNVVRPDDLVVVYFSSHGSTSFSDKNGENYILTYDFDDRNPKSTGLSMQELGRMIKQSLPSDRVVIIVDTCFSGNVKTRDAAATTDVIGAGQIAVTACSANETSVDDDFNESGLFTHYLLENLSKYDGKLKTAFEETRQQVIMAARLRMHEQHPTVNYSRWSGSDAVLFAKPSDPSP